MICGNGSIVSSHGEISVIKSLPASAYLTIKQLIAQYDLTYIIDDTFHYSAKVAPENTILKQLDPDGLALNLPLNEIRTPIKIILLNIPSKIYQEVQAALVDLYQTISIITHTHEKNIDITAKNVNKYTTLAHFFGESDYIAFGNDHNDLELLAHAKKSFLIGEQHLASELGIIPTEIIPKEPLIIAKTIIELV